MTQASLRFPARGRLRAVAMTQWSDPPRCTLLAGSASVSVVNEMSILKRAQKGLKDIVSKSRSECIVPKVPEEVLATFSNACHAMGPEVIRAFKGDPGHTDLADLWRFITRIEFAEPMYGFVTSTISLGHSGRPSLQHLRSRLVKYKKQELREPFAKHQIFE